MTTKNQSRRYDAAWLRADFDGDLFAKDSRRRVREKKTAQLCAQARRALAGAIETELDDPSIPELVLADVRPHPDASNLMALVAQELRNARGIQTGARAETQGRVINRHGRR